MLNILHQLLAPAAVASGVICLCFCSQNVCYAQQRLGEVVDVAKEFDELGNVHFVASELVDFDAKSGVGTIKWDRYERQPSLSFNKLDFPLSRAEGSEFPSSEYDRDPILPFSITTISDRTIRLRFASRAKLPEAAESLMISGSTAPGGKWEVETTDDEITFKSPQGRVVLAKNPWQLTLQDSTGKELTRTRQVNDPATFSAPAPFSFIRRQQDLARQFAAATTLSHNERIYGCGESFTAMNKRGQHVIALTRDAMGAQSQRMYKPIPFYLSSRGYGVFVHTSAPIAFDFGRDFDGTNVSYVGDETLDVFLFVGSPKEVLREYTALTGRSPVPPEWSFGLWMSRITYKSEAEVREVAQQLRAREIPCDVIHLDTGWFDVDWQCDFLFSRDRFPSPKEMLDDLRSDGFRLSLWQLPYFTSKNRLYDEASQAGLFVKNAGGQTPVDDGVLDFSNPNTIEWYRRHLQSLLDLGVAVIKVDFGEDAPLDGLYASGRTGWYERNLYPLRYNQLVAELTKQHTGESIIWARSAWAGSQRYPLHWGGDAENTYSAMAATLRAGLSLGLSGFTFWSHDAGGFVEAPEKQLYARWLAMAVLTSHTRCHGAPPREPWEFGEEFVDLFRKTVEMKYRLLPYIVSQAAICAERGEPMVRSLFFDYPEDNTCWRVDDEYMFGSDLLVAPLFSDSTSRDVYLPPGNWVDYQTGNTWSGGQWHHITSGEIPIVVLAREGALIPHAAVALHTGLIDWKNLEVTLYGEVQENSVASLRLPGGVASNIRVSTKNGEDVKLVAGPSVPELAIKLRRMEQVLQD